MINIIKKIQIRSFQRPSGKDEFQEYIKTCEPKYREKMLETISNIETYGILKAKKNKWMTNIRNTGIKEIRSNVGRNQQRAYCIYDPEIKKYVILTANTKKDMKIKNNWLAKIEIIKIEYNKQSLSQKQKNINNWKSLEVSNRKEPQTMQEINRNEEFKQHLLTITNQDNFNEINQALRLKPQSLNLLINSPSIKLIAPLCEILQLSADDLLQYDSRHTTYPDNPVWHSCQQFAKKYKKPLPVINNELGDSVSKIDRQIPIKILFAVADYYHLSMNQIFKVDIANKQQPQPEPQTTINTSENNKSVETQPTKEKETSIDIFNKITEMLNNQNESVTHYAKTHNLKPNAIFNLKYSNIKNDLIRIGQILDQNVQTLITYKEPVDQQTPAHLKTTKPSPLLNYINDNFKGLAKTDIIRRIKLNPTRLNGFNQIQLIQGLIQVTYDFKITFDELFEKSSKELIELSNQRITKNSDVNPNTNQQTSETPKETSTSTQPIETKSKSTPIVTEVEPKPQKQPTQATPNLTSEPNSRLNRMFEQIKQLSPNQLLILNDLINSWQK